MDEFNFMLCSICLNSWNDNLKPRFLLCGHGFCISCIMSIREKGDYKCPVCRLTEHQALVKREDQNDTSQIFLFEEAVNKVAKLYKETEDRRIENNKLKLEIVDILEQLKELVKIAKLTTRYRNAK